LEPLSGLRVGASVSSTNKASLLLGRCPLCPSFEQLFRDRRAVGLYLPPAPHGLARGGAVRTRGVILLAPRKVKDPTLKYTSSSTRLVAAFYFDDFHCEARH